MVYESDFYTTRRPYSRPTISSYTVTTPRHYVVNEPSSNLSSYSYSSTRTSESRSDGGYPKTSYSSTSERETRGSGPGGYSYSSTSSSTSPNSYSYSSVSSGRLPHEVRIQKSFLSEPAETEDRLTACVVRRTPLKRLGDRGDYDSPYSWPVRREFSRILHRPRPHVGIVYTERFLNSRPLTYFDDETKVIRAKAGAILKQLHTPVVKPSSRLPLTLDTYSLHPHTTYGVPQHIYQQSFFTEPAHITIGRGHLACVQYAGGKSYPRRKNLYSDENRNIRDEIKFRSYYNRSKNEDPNALATGFAWRLLHLPPKEVRPFKLYRHSRTLPNLDSSDIQADKENVKEDGAIKTPQKKYQKRLAELIREDDKPVKTKSNSRSGYTEEPIITENKLKNVQSSIEENKIKIDNSEPHKKERDEVQETEVVTSTNEVTDPDKKKKKKKTEDEKETTCPETSTRNSASLPKKQNSEEQPEQVSTLSTNPVSNAQSPVEKEIPAPELQPSEEEETSDYVTEHIPETLEQDNKDETVQEKEPETEPNQNTLEDIVPEELTVQKSEEIPIEETVQEDPTVHESARGNPELEINESNLESTPEDEVMVPEESKEDLETVERDSITQEIKRPEENLQETVDTKEEENIESNLNEDMTTAEIDVKEELEPEMLEESCIQGKDSLLEEEPEVDVELTNKVPTGDIEDSNINNEEQQSNAIVDFSQTEESSHKYNDQWENNGISETRTDEFYSENTGKDDNFSISYTETRTTVSTREETVIQAADLNLEDTDAFIKSEELESGTINNADQTTDEETLLD